MDDLSNKAPANLALSPLENESEVGQKAESDGSLHIQVQGNTEHAIDSPLTASPMQSGCGNSTDGKDPTDDISRIPSAGPRRRRSSVSPVEKIKQEEHHINEAIHALWLAEQHKSVPQTHHKRVPSLSSPLSRSNLTSATADNDDDHHQQEEHTSSPTPAEDATLPIQPANG